MRWRSGLVAAFLLVSLVKVSRHEMWADELEYWDAARESRSLAELRQNTRYMGQPPLGHLTLYALSRFTRDPRAMQVLNVAETTAAIAVVAAWAPWSAFECALFAFGYFPFFEYGTISRHYALALLLAVGLCAACGRAGRVSLAAGITGLLLALANFHATLVVLAFLTALGAGWIRQRRRPGRHEAAAAGLMASGVILATLCAIPPPDSKFLRPWQLRWEPDRALSAATQLWNGYAPLPPDGPPWWNHNLLDPWPVAKIVLGWALFGLALWAVRRSALALAFLGIGTLGLLAFGYAQWGPYVRHAGLLYLLLVMALWLTGLRGPVLVLVLSLQLPGGLFMSYKDLLLPFSPSTQTAAYLSRPELACLPIVGHEEFIVAPVATLLDRPFYSPASGRWTTRPEFGPRLHPVSEADIRSAVRRIQRQRKSDVLLLVNDNLRPTPRLRFLTCFSEEFVGQHFCIYRAPLSRDPELPASAP
jgi:hypothetical protein